MAIALDEQPWKMSGCSRHQISLALCNTARDTLREFTSLYYAAGAFILPSAKLAGGRGSVYRTKIVQPDFQSQVVHEGRGGVIWINVMSSQFDFIFAR